MINNLVKVEKSKYWQVAHGEPHGTREEFDIKKISMALVRAGAQSADIDAIVELIEPFEGMTTGDIDKIVVEELDKRDPDTAKYWKMKRDYYQGRFKR